MHILHIFQEPPKCVLGHSGKQNVGLRWAWDLPRLGKIKPSGSIIDFKDRKGSD